ncbi:MAG: hypothetical protein AMXMBFR13_24780 [Phycisphaerae bacterium]
MHLGAVSLCLLVALAPLGLVLLKQGLWPPRRGTTPRCRRCEYNLTGLTIDRCPECGTTLGLDQIVHGERHRSPGRVVLGVVCLLPLMATSVLVVRGIRWYRYYPGFLIMRDLQSGSGIVSGRALRELMRREDTNSLSAGTRSDLIDVCLQQQATDAPGLPTSEMVDYLGRCALAGRLSDAQRSRFLNQIGQLTLQVRPRVAPGDPVPLWLGEQCRGLSGGRFWMTLKGAEVFVDGKTTGLRFGGGGASSGYGAGGGSGITMDPVVPGLHTVEFKPRVLVYSGKFHEEQASTLLHEREVPLKATFEVLPTEPDNYIALIKNPSLTAQVRASTTLDEFRIESQRRKEKPTLRMKGKIHFKSLPVSVAFDVFARTNGHEYPLGTVRCIKGGSTSYPVSPAWNAGPITQCDVIIRSNPQIARKTVDLFEIWDGELVYEDVPVQVMSNE